MTTGYGAGRSQDVGLYRLEGRLQALDLELGDEVAAFDTVAARKRARELAVERSEGDRVEPGAEVGREDVGVEVAVAGEAALLVDPTDRAALLRGLERLVDDPDGMDG